MNKSKLSSRPIFEWHERNRTIVLSGQSKISIETAERKLVVSVPRKTATSILVGALVAHAPILIHEVTNAAHQAKEVMRVSWNSPNDGGSDFLPIQDLTATSVVSGTTITYSDQPDRFDMIVAGSTHSFSLISGDKSSC